MPVDPNEFRFDFNFWLGMLILVSVAYVAYKTGQTF